MGSGRLLRMGCENEIYICQTHSMFCLQAPFSYHLHVFHFTTLVLTGHINIQKKKQEITISGRKEKARKDKSQFLYNLVGAPKTPKTFLQGK